MTTTQSFIFGLEPGTRVSGKYFGEAIEGTVTSRRSHTMNWNWHLVHVALDESQTIGGVEHKGLHFDLDADGYGDYDCCLTVA